MRMLHAAIMLLLLLPQAKAGAGVDYQIRSVSDISCLDLRPIADSTDQIWVVFRLTPAEEGNDQGRRQRQGEGRDESPFGVQPDAIRHVAGRWSVISVLEGELDKASGDYEWQEPVFHFDHKSGPARISALHDPFENGGVVICRYDPTATDEDMFADVLLIPEGWGAELSSAYEAYAKIRGDLGGAGDTDSLRDRIQSRNRIVSTVALRHALESGQLDAEAVESILSESDGVKLSVFVHLAIRAPLRMTVGAEGVSEAIKDADEAVELEDIAVGLASALIRSEEKYVLGRGERLLLQIKERMAALDISLNDNEVLGRVFSVVGVE